MNYYREARALRMGEQWVVVCMGCGVCVWGGGGALREQRAGHTCWLNPLFPLCSLC